MLPTLIAFGLEESHRERAKALLILRNLLAFPANKPVLVTNGNSNLSRSLLLILLCLFRATAECFVTETSLCKNNSILAICHSGVYR